MTYSSEWERYCHEHELRIDPSNSRCAVLGSPSPMSSTEIYTYESQLSMVYNENHNVEILKESTIMTSIKRFWPSKKLIKPMWSKFKKSKLKFKRKKKKSKKKQVLDLNDFKDQTTAAVPARHVSTPLAIPLFAKSCLKNKISQDFNHLLAISKTSLSSQKSSVKSVFDTSSNIHTNATTPN